MLNNKTYLCTEDYHSKFPVMKLMDGLCVDNLTKMCRIIYAGYGLPRKITSDIGTNFGSESFQKFCRQYSSSCHCYITNRVMYKQN